MRGNDMFIAISSNCRSLSSKYDELKIFIQDYDRKRTKISAICVQEKLAQVRLGSVNVSFKWVPNYIPR